MRVRVVRTAAPRLALPSDRRSRGGRRALGVALVGTVQLALLSIAAGAGGSAAAPIAAPAVVIVDSPRVSANEATSLRVSQWPAAWWALGRQAPEAAGVVAESTGDGDGGDLDEVEPVAEVEPLDTVSATAPEADAALALQESLALQVTVTGAQADQVGIPQTVLAAYRQAELLSAASKPSCHLPWWLLAGIGRIESGHGQGGRVDAAGTTRGRILGPVLDGSLPGSAVIADTDGGALDGDPVYDRAVGPMQFLPGTWRAFARDGNGDRILNPHNVFDAATTAAAYLCRAGGDLSDPAGLSRAVLAYNHSDAYLRAVLAWGLVYRDHASPTPDQSGAVAPTDPAVPTTTAPAPTEATPTSSSAPTTTESAPTEPAPTEPPTSTSTSSTSSPTSTEPSPTSSTSTPPPTDPTTSEPPPTTESTSSAAPNTAAAARASTAAAASSSASAS